MSEKVFEFRCPVCKVRIKIGEDSEIGGPGWCPNCEQNLEWDGKNLRALSSKVYDFLRNASADVY
jgi:endogenous inhibitor of DNA gyrase (YacG/DUF329 family)